MTGHYFALRDMKYLTDVKEITNGTRISLPNGDFVTAKYTGSISFPDMPPMQVYIFAHLSGLTISEFVDAGFYANYDIKYMSV